MQILKQIFTWWNGQTIGTRLFTARSGKHVGDDDFGNHYYESTDGKRRWVIYKDYATADHVPAEWHGWLHHTFLESPAVQPLMRRDWEKDHQPNMTGTNLAYRPDGSLHRPEEERLKAKAYQAWQPE